MHRLAPLFLFACSGLTPRSAPADYACFDADVDAGGSLTVEVTHDCVTGSAEDYELSCTVLVSEGIILVDAEATWMVGSEQTDDCNTHAASCVAGNLEAGTYTVIFEDAELEITVGGAGGVGEVCLPDDA